MSETKEETVAARRFRASHWLVGSAVACAAVGLAACAATGPRRAPRDEAAMRQAEDVLNRLTLEEKVALTHGEGTMSVAANPAKGIPTPLTLSDGPHTVRQDLRMESFAKLRPGDDMTDASTVFPALSVLAATWDPELARRFGEAMGTEARDRGKDILLGPGVNLARTPLCGRNWEYMGEDPYLTARMAVPVIRGIQSKDVAACVKHFAANSQEWNRGNVDEQVDERTLRELYLPAFEAAVKEGGVLTVMNAYNRLNGPFCSHNAWLNNGVLKGEWGFPGLVMTDWGSVHDTVEGALGGTDLEMSAGQSIRYFKEPLAQAVREGKVPEARLDDMARRVLYVQAKLGKLDGRTRAKGARNTPEHQALAREIAADGMVLLKNDNGLLPLAPKALRRVLVVGRNATERHCRGGSSAEGKPPHEITPLEGLRSALPGVEIVQVPFPAPKTSFDSLPDAILLTENPSKTNDTGMRDAGWAWERFANGALSGTPAATGFIRAPGLAKEEKGTNFSMRWRTRFRAPESGRYTFGFTCDDGARLVLDGKPLIDDWQDGAARTRSAEIDLAAGSEHDLVLEYRQAGGDAVLAFGWRLPSERGVDVSALLAEAKKADTVILMPGTRHGWGRALECEGGDRPDLLLAPGENESIAALLREKARTVVVLHAGSPLELPWADQAKTLLLMSYSGQEAGHALADVLLGKREPSGRLTCTWPRRLADSPAHALDCYKADASKHKEGLLLGYRWFDAKSIAPLFPFGYGLGYATFAFGTPEAKVRGDGVTLRVPVTNTSARAGAAVVQVYVEPPAQGPVPRAPRQLKAFAKLRLAPGETGTAELTLEPRAFAYWDVALPGWRHEAGTFTLAVGTSSRDLSHRVAVELPAWEEPCAVAPDTLVGHPPAALAE